MMYMGNFVWVWIAAAERTKNMQFITGVTAPIYRYHPAIMYIVPAQMK
jgi:alkanesulfonate monooxygenase SsuD/methylene tetrahydromethanopterin reductase-like flavin-dependent oxidoreductase (luciferase family)